MSVSPMVRVVSTRTRTRKPFVPMCVHFSKTLPQLNVGPMSNSKQSKRVSYDLNLFIYYNDFTVFLAKTLTGFESRYLRALQMSTIPEFF